MATAETITAQGTGTVGVRAVDKDGEAKIRRAVNSASRAALRNAIVDARREAAQIASASGLYMGAFIEVDSTPTQNPFFFTGPFPRFGPNRFCGIVRSSRVVTVKRRRRVIRGPRRKVCDAPPYVTRTVSVTFDAVRAPVPPPTAP